METTWTLQEKAQGELKVVINGQQWLDAQDRAFNKLAKQVELPGFRKGQAPKALVRKQIKDQNIMMEAVDEIATDALIKGIDEHQLHIITRPELGLDAMTAEEVTLTFKLTLEPEVKLGAYTDVQVKKAEALVTDDDVNEKLKQLQERFAELVVKEGVVSNGDTAVIDFEGFQDGVAFEGGKGENHPLQIGSNSFIPGFEEQIIGMSVNEEKEVNVTFPEEYQSEDLAGKPATFKVKVNEIKVRVLPELNDEFAKEVDRKDVENLEQLKASLLDELQLNKQKEVDEAAENELLTKVVEACEVDIPDVMVNEELERTYDDFKNRLAQQGLNMDLYKQFTGQDEAALKEQMRPDAYNKVKVRLVLGAIAKAEKLEASSEEVEEEYKTMANLYQMEIDKVKEAISTSALQYDLVIRKAYDFIKKAIN
ncbi:MAG: trigger factor [Erysipelotrichaceae bacterium]|nr:trigger factor [Erysipelotrichaceae bacterium]